MADPIVFIIRNRVKEGMLADFVRHYQLRVPPIVAGKPETLVQLAYVGEDATEVTIVRVFPSADAMDIHLQGASERSKKPYEYIEPTSVEIYGVPGQSTIELMKKIAGTGLVVSVHPRFIGGFVRPKSG